MNLASRAVHCIAWLVIAWQSTCGTYSFAVENTFRIALYSIIGVITLSSLKQSLILAPIMLLGLFAGMKSGKILNEKTVKQIVVILLIISGIALILMNI